MKYSHPIARDTRGWHSLYAEAQSFQPRLPFDAILLSTNEECVLDPRMQDLVERRDGAFEFLFSANDNAPSNCKKGLTPCALFVSQLQVIYHRAGFEKKGIASEASEERVKWLFLMLLVADMDARGPSRSEQASGTNNTTSTMNNNVPIIIITPPTPQASLPPPTPPPPPQSSGEPQKGGVCKFMGSDAEVVVTGLEFLKGHELTPKNHEFLDRLVAQIKEPPNDEPTAKEKARLALEHLSRKEVWRLNYWWLQGRLVTIPQYESNTKEAEQINTTSSKHFSPLFISGTNTMDLESDSLEGMKGMIIDVIAMVFEPAIKTYAKAPENNKSHQASLFVRPEIERTECDHAALATKFSSREAVEKAQAKSETKKHSTDPTYFRSQSVAVVPATRKRPATKHQNHPSQRLSWVVEHLGKTVQELSFLIQRCEKSLPTDPSIVLTIEDMKLERAKAYIQEYSAAELAPDKFLKTFRNSPMPLAERAPNNIDGSNLHPGLGIGIDFVDLECAQGNPAYLFCSLHETIANRKSQDRHGQ
ncbi:hypothetical protein BDR22DRAFT_891988 [Usnea florida]